MSDKIAPNLRRFREAIFRHDELNPTHKAYGIGLAYFDMQRLGFDEGEELWPGVTVQTDGGVSANFRVLCDRGHPEEHHRVEADGRRCFTVGAEEVSA
jgi:hypothetical protein